MPAVKKRSARAFAGTEEMQSTLPSLREVDEDATGKSGLPRGDGERIALLEKDIENYGRLLEQENPAQVEMQEQAVTLAPGKAISPFAVVPQSTPSVHRCPHRAKQIVQKEPGPFMRQRMSRWQSQNLCKPPRFP